MTQVLRNSSHTNIPAPKKRIHNFACTNASKKLRLNEAPLSPPLTAEAAAAAAAAAPSNSSSSVRRPSFVKITNHSDESDSDSVVEQQPTLMHRRGSSIHPPISAAQISNNGSMMRRRKSFAVPDADRIARQNCFEYLVSAIDEVWAQYCVETSTAEADRYDEAKLADLPSSPVSLCGEDEDDEDDEDDSEETEDMASCPGTPRYSMRRMSKSGSSYAADVNAPESVRILNLKKRLMNAKYFLADLTDVMDPVASQEFWSKFDVIKYELITVLEENGDDDDVVESVCEDLESGRYYSR